MTRTGRRKKQENPQSQSDRRLDVGKSWLQQQQRSAYPPSCLLSLEHPSILSSQMPQQLPAVILNNSLQLGAMKTVIIQKTFIICDTSQTCNKHIPVAVAVAVVHLDPSVEPFQNLIILQLQAAFHCIGNEGYKI